MSAAVAVLFQAGLTAITNAITLQAPVEVAKWELGQQANAEVSPSATSALPTAIYTGSPSSIITELENGVAVFNIIIDGSVGDFYVGNIALKVIDPASSAEVLLAIIMFPQEIFKMKSEAFGGAPGEVGRYYVAKLSISLATANAIANITVDNTDFSVIPSVDNLQRLAPPDATPYPHQIMLSSPETGAPSLLVKRPGDNLWWSFGLSWPVMAYNFGVISGGYQGDWYATDNIEVIFGGYFHFGDSDFDGSIIGGSNWSSPSVNTINGGNWS